MCIEHLSFVLKDTSFVQDEINDDLNCIYHFTFEEYSEVYRQSYALFQVLR